ncbi:MAG: FG-GAP-like repeat-containing protein [Planctomycetota bacterium]
MRHSRFVLAIALMLAPRIAAQNKTEDAWREINAGVALLEQQSPAKASERFRAALKLDEKLTPARINLSIALYHVSNFAEAQAEARAAAIEAPDSPHAHYMVGLAARQLSDTNVARAAFERVLALDAFDCATRIYLARACLETGEIERARGLLVEAVEREPFNVTAVYSLATTLQRLGKREEAKPFFARFQTLRASGYAVTLGTQYLETGRYGAAVTARADSQLFDSRTAKFSLRPPEQRATAALPARREFGEGAVVDAAGKNELAQRQPPGLLLADLDADGNPEALLFGGGGVIVWRNNDAQFAAQAPLLETPAIGALAGDLNGDARTDLLLLAADGLHLWLQDANTVTFLPNAASAPLPQPAGLLTTGCLADVDHDGDLDVFAAGTTPTPMLLRNNGDGSFTDIAAASGFTIDSKVSVAAAASDLDLGRDTDLLLLRQDASTLVFRNRRDGSFVEAGARMGFAATRAAATSLALGDYNKDGFEDVFLGRRELPGLIFTSDGRAESWKSTDAPAATGDADAALFADLDCDGWLDLITLAAGRLALDRGSNRAFTPFPPGTAPDASLPARALGVADVDRDGDLDIVLADSASRPMVLTNDLADAKSVIVTLAGRVSNKSGLGTKLDFRAGSLAQKIECGMSTPASTPATLHIGLGGHARPDAVRLLWPSGNVQAELPPEALNRGMRWEILEVDRMPSSCPNLYTWDGQRFRYVSDFLGGGEMGAWVAEGIRNQPDPEEFVRIPTGALEPRDGRLELRITNELEEALFVDHLSLVAVDHPASVDVYPNEGLSFVAARPWKLHVIEAPQPPLHASDDAGRDHTAAVAATDRVTVEGFPLHPVRGFAAPHWLECEFAALPAHPVLLLTGWTDYAFSSDTRRAQQAGLNFEVPVLEARTRDGAWRVVEADIGIPVGHPQTVCIELAGRLQPFETRLRLRTNMRVYWDAVAIANACPAAVPRISRQWAVAADLRWRGYSARTFPGGRNPCVYEYERVTTESPWKSFAGAFTRTGDVRELVERVDNGFVICTTGDEIELSFSAAAFPSLPAGWTRTWLLHADGYSKEMDPNSATPDRLLPLPFHGMSQYPYGPEEKFPLTPQLESWLESLNTRFLRGHVPFLPAASEATQ